MRTRTRILISAGASLAISAAVVFIIFHILRDVEKEAGRSRVYDKIRDKTYALNLLTASFPSWTEPSRIRQIRDIQRSLEDLLGAMSSFNAPEETLILQIKTSSREAGFFIDKLISASLDQRGAMEAERYNLLVSQLRMKTQSISDDTHRLITISQSRIAAAHRNADVLSIALIVTLIFTNIAIYFFSGRSIVRMQEGLRVSEEHERERAGELQGVLDMAPIAIWFAHDPDCRRITGNAAADLILQAPSGANISASAPPVESAVSYKVFRDGMELQPEQMPAQVATATGKPVLGDELKLVFADGRKLHLVESAVPLLNADGRVRGAIITGEDITMRKKAEAELRERENLLRTSLDEKGVLLKEIHHRVKNNMQVISSLIGLQADELQDGTVRAVLRDMTHRVRSMAMVHEKLYQSVDLARVEFGEYARSLLNYLWRSHGSAASGIRLALDLEPVSLPVDLAVPCGLILNELVSNALKHAFSGRNNAEVAVSLHSGRDDQVRLCVRDNGAGLPDGFDWTQARTLGLRLVQMLAGQIHAAVEVSGGDGTKFEITFGCIPSPS